MADRVRPIAAWFTPLTGSDSAIPRRPTPGACATPARRPRPARANTRCRTPRTSSSSTGRDAPRDVPVRDVVRGDDGGPPHIEGTPPSGRATASPRRRTSSAPSATSAPALLDVEVVSTSVWAGRPDPVILTLSGDGARIDDPACAGRPSFQRRITGAPVEAIPVQAGCRPRLLRRHRHDPSPGAWRLE
jgi:hypothetical protein